MLSSHSLANLIDKPTRVPVTPTSATELDHFRTNNSKHQIRAYVILKGTKIIV